MTIYGLCFGEITNRDGKSSWLNSLTDWPFVGVYTSFKAARQAIKSIVKDCNEKNSKRRDDYYCRMKDDDFSIIPMTADRIPTKKVMKELRDMMCGGKPEDWVNP